MDNYVKDVVEKWREQESRFDSVDVKLDDLRAEVRGGFAEMKQLVQSFMICYGYITNFLIMPILPVKFELAQICEKLKLKLVDISPGEIRIRNPILASQLLLPGLVKAIQWEDKNIQILVVQIYIEKVKNVSYLWEDLNRKKKMIYDLDGFNKPANPLFRSYKDKTEL